MADITEEDVIAALSEVIDPSQGRSVVDLGMVTAINIKQSNISFALEVPAAAAELFQQSETFRCLIGNLQLIVGKYNWMQTTLMDVERPLLERELRAMDVVRAILLCCDEDNDVPPLSMDPATAAEIVIRFKQFWWPKHEQLRKAITRACASASTAFNIEPSAIESTRIESS